MQVTFDILTTQSCRVGSMSRECLWLRLGDVVCLFTLHGLFYFSKLCLDKREEGIPLCLFTLE